MFFTCETIGRVIRKKAVIQTARKMIGLYLFFLKISGNSSIKATNTVSTIENYMG